MAGGLHFELEGDSEGGELEGDFEGRDVECDPW